MTKISSGVAITIVVIIIFLAIFIPLAGLDIVDANHLGVMNRFGVIKGVMQSGITNI